MEAGASAEPESYGEEGVCLAPILAIHGTRIGRDPQQTTVTSEQAAGWRDVTSEPGKSEVVALPQHDWFMLEDKGGAREVLRVLMRHFQKHVVPSLPSSQLVVDDERPMDSMVAAERRLALPKRANPDSFLPEHLGFVHIPKCAGSAIEDAFKDCLWGRNAFAGWKHSADDPCAPWHQHDPPVRSADGRPRGPRGLCFSPGPPADFDTD